MVYNILNIDIMRILPAQWKTGLRETLRNQPALPHMLHVRFRTYRSAKRCSAQGAGLFKIEWDNDGNRISGCSASAVSDFCDGGAVLWLIQWNKVSALCGREKSQEACRYSDVYAVEFSGAWSDGMSQQLEVTNNVLEIIPAVSTFDVFNNCDASDYDLLW